MPAGPAALAAAAAAADAGDGEGAVALIAEAVAAAPEDRALRLRAALLHARLGRPGAALALARSALEGPAEPELSDLAAMVADRLLALGWAGAAAELARRAAVLGRGRPALRRLLLAAGLPAYRQSLQQAPDGALLAAMAEAAAADPTALPLDDLLELARLLEEAGRDDLLRRIGAAALAQGGPTARALTRPGMGAVQSLEGLAHAATGRAGRAALAFAAAHAGFPADPSARFNAAFAALAGGELAEAERLFGGLPAAGEPMLAGAAWPHFGELPWPFAGPPAKAQAAFAALLPAGARWPRIRLVTPCLNPGPWLEEAILSVAGQGYPALEHVVVDGGSSDGTAEVLARQRHRLHAVIRGPDAGPAEAIMKGLAGCEADLVGWLNADDLLAPGALHHLGAAFAAAAEADLVHGYAVAHRGRRIIGVQRPLAEGPEAFTLEGLADIFGRWAAGAFFLQPEVLLARRFFERLGGLDTGLSAVFDYELWLRAARARPRIAQVAWPVAFYRVHPGQRSGRRAALAAEQVMARDRHVQPAPPPARRAEITARLRAALCRPDRPARLLLLDPASAETLSAAARAEAQAALAAEGVRLAVATDVPEGAVEAELVLRLLGAHDGTEWVARLRARGFAGPVIGWFTEEDEDASSSAAMARAPDVVIPSRPARRGVLLQDRALVTEAMAPPSGLVSVAEAAALFAAGPTPGGGSGDAPWEPGPARLAAALAGEGPMPAADRHAVVLALLAGRVPAPARPGLMELLPALPEEAAARHALGRGMLLAPRLALLLARLRALAGPG